MEGLEKEKEKKTIDVCDQFENVSKLYAFQTVMNDDGESEQVAWDMNE